MSSSQALRLRARAGVPSNPSEFEPKTWAEIRECRATARALIAKSHAIVETSRKLQAVSASLVGAGKARRGKLKP